MKLLKYSIVAAGVLAAQLSVPLSARADDGVSAVLGIFGSFLDMAQKQQNQQRQYQQPQYQPQPQPQQQYRYQQPQSQQGGGSYVDRMVQDSQSRLDRSARRAGVSCAWLLNQAQGNRAILPSRCR